MKNNKFFFSSRKANGIYFFLIKSCIQKSGLKFENTELVFFNKSIFIDVVFVIQNIFILFFGLFFNRNFLINIKFKKIKIGKYILSDCYKSCASYFYKIFFIYLFLKSFFKAAILINRTKKLIKNVNFNFAYLDHVEYLNGIAMEILKKNSKTIYTNKYPKNIIQINKNTDLNSYFKISNDSKRDIKKRKINLIKNKIFSDPSYFPWMKKINFEPIKCKLDEYEYIIYLHSFTDAQLVYGYDGFVNTLDWLTYTIDFLTKKKKKIILKAHPNFYNYNNNNSNCDKKIFSKLIKNKYQNNKNILILDKSYKNYVLKKKLRPDCIVITHHGTVSLEMIYFGFKVISSSATFWDDKYKLTNTWRNKIEYQKILNKSWEKLNFSDQNHFDQLFSNLFISDNNFYGKNFYLNIIRNNLLKNKLINNGTTFIEIVKYLHNLEPKNKIFNNIKLII